MVNGLDVPVIVAESVAAMAHQPHPAVHAFQDPVADAQVGSSRNGVNVFADHPGESLEGLQT